ncbi:hypothetical protein OTU49_014355, partial [Cherax quadricarinatus]
DINECEHEGVCQHGVCNNFQGSFQCICDPGYVLTADRSSCIDLDECVRSPNICNNGTCLNSMGSYQCQCYRGFKIGPNRDCIDVNECLINVGLCVNGRCRNTEGSFRCECADGYTLTPNGEQCRDINECSERDDVCPAPGRCQNLMGSFICDCPEGFILAHDGMSCIDVDECTTVENICENGECINGRGTFQCVCPPGFEVSPDGTKCIDHRQEECYERYEQGTCLEPRPVRILRKECCCSSGAAWGLTCDRCPHISSAEFEKLCPLGPGRSESGADLNECEIMPGSCQGGDCVNTDGSFRCECPMGYVLDHSGRRCVDDNECAVSSVCGNGTCSNVEGGFECSCQDGFAPGPMQ